MRRKMTYDGVLIEEAIPGYRTLSIEGRQFNENDLDTTENPGDGSTFVNKRVIKRELTIGFMIKRTTGLTLRQAQDKLLTYLNKKEPKQLILSDEPDVYFNAIFEKAKVSEEHDNVRSGELIFICPDPYKHAVETRTFTATKNSDGVLTATVENTGNVATPIDYEITMNSDNGFIGIVSDEGIMQYGTLEEVDGHDYQRSERLLTLSDVLSASDDESGTGCYIQPDLVVNGALGSETANGRTWLKLASSGSGTGWHGGQRTITLPADSNGDLGATNFYIYLRHWFENWKLAELGLQGISILDDDNTMIAGWRINKVAAGASKSYCEFFSNNKQLESTTFEAINSSANLFTASNGNNCIYKEGSKITFYINGKGYRSFVVPEIATLKATKVQITIAARGTANAMTRNYLGAFDFDKLYVDKWSDDPNRYSKGDVLTIDGSKGKIYVNGMIRMGDEVIGTEYFKANAGTNEIQFYNSSWASDVTAKAIIREAWL